MAFGCFTNQQNINRVQLFSHIYQKKESLRIIAIQKCVKCIIKKNLLQIILFEGKCDLQRPFVNTFPLFFFIGKIIR